MPTPLASSAGAPPRPIASQSELRWSQGGGLAQPSGLSVRSSGESPTRQIFSRAGPAGAVVGVLIGVEGKLEGEVYKVRDGNNRLGRLKGSEITLDDRDDTVSREHAVVIHRDGTFGLKSLKRENPTWVNGEEVEIDAGTPLRDGDTIRVGQSTFRFRTA